MLATEVRSADAPKLPFSLKTYENLKTKSENQPQINHRKFVPISESALTGTGCAAELGAGPNTVADFKRNKRDMVCV